MDINLESEVIIINDDDDDVPDLIISKRRKYKTVNTEKIIVIDDNDKNSTNDISKLITPMGQKYENTDKGKILTINNNDIPELIKPKTQKYGSVDKGKLIPINNNHIYNVPDVIKPKSRKNKITGEGKLNTTEDIPKLIIPKRLKYNRDKGKKRKRQVKVDTSRNNTETLIITQKVAVKRQNIKCIINLTNVCDYKNNIKTKGKTNITELKGIKGSGSCKKFKSEEYLKTSVKERIVPHCLRKCCQSAILSKRYKWRQARKRYQIKYTSRKASKANASNSKNTTSLVNDHFSLSRSDEKYDSDISYDSISSDSFCSFDYEEVKDLDTLIKRTRNREKNTRTSCDELPLSDISSTSTLCRKENDNSSIPKSETDVSIHSLATLLLETRSDDGFHTDRKSCPTLSPEKFAYYCETNPGNEFLEEQQVYTSKYPTLRPDHKLYSSSSQLDHDTPYELAQTVGSEKKAYSYNPAMSLPNLPATVKSEKTEVYDSILNPERVHTPYSPTISPNCFYPVCDPTKFPEANSDNLPITVKSEKTVDESILSSTGSKCDCVHTPYSPTTSPNCFYPECDVAKLAQTVCSEKNETYSYSPTMSISNLPIILKSDKTEDDPILSSDCANTPYSPTMSPNSFYPECDVTKLAETVCSKNKAYSYKPSISISNLPIILKSEDDPILSSNRRHTPYSPTMSPNCFYRECDPTKFAQTVCSEKNEAYSYSPTISISNLPIILKSEKTEDNPILSSERAHTPYSPTMSPNCFYPKCDPKKLAQTVCSEKNEAYSYSPIMSISNLPITLKSENTEDDPKLSSECITHHILLQ